MRHGTKIGALLVVAALALWLGGAVGWLPLIPGVVLGALATVMSIVAFVVGRIGAGFERSRRLMSELPALGVRLRGTVRDVVPFGAAHGGAVLHAEGVLMILRVEVDRGPGGSQLVNLLVVEPTEVARSRLGTEVTVVEHPAAPNLRALEGHAPNGHLQPAGTGEARF